MSWGSFWLVWVALLAWDLSGLWHDANNAAWWVFLGWQLRGLWVPLVELGTAIAEIVREWREWRALLRRT